MEFLSLSFDATREISDVNPGTYQFLGLSPFHTEERCRNNSLQHTVGTVLYSQYIDNL